MSTEQYVYTKHLREEKFTNLPEAKKIEVDFSRFIRLGVTKSQLDPNELELWLFSGDTQKELEAHTTGTHCVILYINKDQVKQPAWMASYELEGSKLHIIQFQGTKGLGYKPFSFMEVTELFAEETIIRAHELKVNHVVVDLSKIPGLDSTWKEGKRDLFERIVKKYRVLVEAMDTQKEKYGVSTTYLPYLNEEAYT